MSEQQDMVWVATKGDNEFVGEDPITLLGLIKLAEVRGEDWHASDSEIDKYMALLKGDV